MVDENTTYVVVWQRLDSTSPSVQVLDTIEQVREALTDLSNPEQLVRDEPMVMSFRNSPRLGVTRADLATNKVILRWRWGLAE